MSDFDPIDPTDDKTIPILNRIDEKRRKATPNLWVIPKMTKDIPESSEAQLNQYQKTYTDILYSVGKEKYGLLPNLDFVVEVVIPTGNLSALGFQVVGGPIVHVVLPICSISDFEQKIHRILRDVKEMLHSKSVEVRTKLHDMDKALKAQCPPFMTYDQLDGHKLEVLQEQKITITDKSTGATVTRIKKEDKESWRIMVHRAKLELIEVNRMIREIEKEKAREKTYVEQSHEV